MALEQPTEETWSRFFAGEKLACARLITLVDNYPEKVQTIRDRLFPHMHQAVRIGITGPPGVGKSTITAALARQALAEDFSVGIIAVDPSSPFTGGAFLGDRVRMQNLIGNPRVFIRSLASRSGGGLSPSTPYVADVFDAFGMDLILIETVGVGQAELDVLKCADVIMLILQPSTGDIIQMLKAGIMETADVFVINKSDLPGATQLKEHIRFIFTTSSVYTPENTPPVVEASALNETGIDEVFSVLRGRIGVMRRSGRFQEKRRERTMSDVIDSVKTHLWSEFMRRIVSVDSIRENTEEIADSGRSPYPFIRSLCDAVEVRMRDGSVSGPDSPEE
ncbi:MAG TPA: methylmalonyl Co-A mutase-associated GTPase MeaB [bacterium]|nr:methylmalonyl Co-A mutase-associated GTPase MeaB [bacterium]